MKEDTDKARAVADAIAKTPPGSTAKDLLDRLGEALGMTGRELFDEMKRRPASDGDEGPKA